VHTVKPSDSAQDHPKSSPAATDEVGDGAPIAALWAYLSSWLSPEGGVNGPVVHRGGLKRMFSIHDTPWTQHGTVAGLLHLYRRSGRSYWLDNALRLADAQCARLEADGRFRWAGHEDDRFSSLENRYPYPALLKMKIEGIENRMEKKP